MNKFPLPLVLFFALAISANAQSFSSGSTGADGALDLSAANRIVQLPESGVLNYTTISIPSGRILTFKRNLRNTPVTILAQGDVVVAGTIDVSGGVPFPGPGGFYGGSQGRSGFGPGGGQPGQNGDNAKWVGPLSLVPIVGGSGGAGGGSGGGGAIVIASSTSINISGTITASATYADNAVVFHDGSGGAIRLVANSLVVSGSLGACGVVGNCGVVRLEAPSNALAFSGTSNPPAGLFPINSTITTNSQPVLTIVSIGGSAVPSYAGSRFDTYDMLLPNQLADPISVVLQASNIPVGTQVLVGFVNGSNSASSTTGTLSGTLESSTATATISNLNRTAVTYLLATAIFDPPTGAMKFNPSGPNHVAKVRVVASPGAKPKLVFLRKNGTEVDVASLPKQFLDQLGL